MLFTTPVFWYSQISAPSKGASLTLEFNYISLKHIEIAVVFGVIHDRRRIKFANVFINCPSTTLF